MEFQKSEGRIFAQDETGKLVAEITFPTVAEGVAAKAVTVPMLHVS